MRKTAFFAPLALAVILLAGCSSSSDGIQPDPALSGGPVPEETMADFDPNTTLAAPAAEVAETIAGILKQNSGTDATVDCGETEFQLKDGATVECKLTDVDGKEYKVSAVVMLTSDGKSYALSPRVLKDAAQ